MASYTATDLTAVETAISQTIQGNKVIQFSVGEKFFKFGEADLGRLYEWRTEIQISLGLIVGRTYAKQGGRAS